MLQRRITSSCLLLEQLIWGHKLLQTAVMRAAEDHMGRGINILSPLTRLPSGALQRIGVLRCRGDG